MNYQIPIATDGYFYHLSELLDCLGYDWKFIPSKDVVEVALSEDTSICNYECEIMRSIVDITFKEFLIRMRLEEMEDD